MKKILTWVKPTGNGMHLGNYLGMYKPFIENSKWKEGFLFIPDFHSLTSVHDKETMQKNKRRLLIEVFSLLPEESDIVVFEQSKVRRINDITWVLSSVTPYSLMLRAHSFKDSKNKNSDTNMAVFNYPILMTADIITYDVELVPVGNDQKQHIEFARDIAENFNKTYKKEVFKLPEEHIEKEVWIIPWTDGKKMSKSYDNFIGVFDDEKLLKKKIMSIQTDDTPLEEPKNPDTCNVFALIKFFASEQRKEEVRNKYLAGNYVYGHAKLELLEILLEYFKKPREKYAELEKNFEYIEKKLASWNIKANEIADRKYEEILKVIGL